jgi:hypothetical protein
MADRGFRVNDRVTVHNWILADKAATEGRVVCTNRLSKYGESVIVLSAAQGVEHILTFTPEGKRYLPESGCHISLGFKP